MRRPILVIDDDNNVGLALSYALGRAGYQVETTTSSKQGLSKAEELTPAVVFLDAIMPNMNGFAICEQLRRQPELRNTWVIMLSALDRDSDIRKGLEAGADEYIVKPFSPREIVEHVNGLFQPAACASQ
jgi:two-component system phosphate regulon response regulator PhoB